MATQIGIWIDHHAARLVRLTPDTGESPSITTVKADAESHHRSFGGEGTATPGHVGGGMESHYQRRRDQQLERFYQRVIDAVRDASEVVLLGPAEARGELTRLLEDDRSLRLEIVASERCDHLTDPQLMKKIDDLFRHHHAGRA